MSVMRVTVQPDEPSAVPSAALPMYEYVASEECRTSGAEAPPDAEIVMVSPASFGVIVTFVPATSVAPTVSRISSGAAVVSSFSARAVA